MSKYTKNSNPATLGKFEFFLTALPYKIESYNTFIESYGITNDYEISDQPGDVNYMHDGSLNGKCTGFEWNNRIR